MTVQLDESAARLSACTGLSSSNVVSFFGSEWLGGASEPRKACVRAAADCAELLACAGFEPQACVAGCEGTVARNCAKLPNGLEVAVREECAQNAAGNRACSLIVDESKGDFALCHSGRACSRSSCVENVGLYCDRDHEVRFPCAVAELCFSDEVTTTCLRPEACEHDRCEADGQTLSLCAHHKVIASARCDAVVPGTRCTQSLIGAECEAKVADPSCDGRPFDSFCDGDVAVACFLGVRHEIDCAPVGGCVAIGSDARCEASP